MSQRLRIFVSSPSDVPDERLRAALIVDKLSQDYSRFFFIEPYRWEHEAMLASGHFQDAIEPPSDFDIVVLILWSRLGTPLPEKTAERDYRGIDGRAPVTGTEWEYEEALKAAQEKKAPDLLAFRNISPTPIDPRDPDAQAKSLAQLSALNAFWTRHFADRGVFLAAYDEYRTLEEFAQRLEESLRKLIERRIKDVSAGELRAEPIWLGEPFRGLEPYEFEHAPIFFGRDAAVTKAIEQLAANAHAGHAFLLVSGASGSGKSSLVKAGVVPRLTKPQRISGAAFVRRTVFRPGAEGADVFFGLAKVLTRALGQDVGLPELIAPGQDAAQLAAHLRGAVGDPGYLFANALGRLTEAERKSGRLLAFEDAKLILVVDQLEELFTVAGVGPGDRRLFVQVLAGLARSGAVWVIATVRADFWHRAAEIPELIALAEGHGRIDLAAASPAELAEMIRKPAHAAGLSFEVHPESGLGLDAVLAQDAAAAPGALPLLSFTLDKLYKETKERGETVLTHASYEALGGLKGAIASRADAVLASLAEPAQLVLPRILRALVTVGSDANAIITARPVPLDRFPEDSSERQLIDAFLAARLLVSEQGEGPAIGARIRVAHEALLNHWGRARDWINAHRADLQLEKRIEIDAARWVKAANDDRAGLLLPSGLRLSEAQDLLSRCGNDLPGEVQSFIAESATAEADRARAEQEYLRQILRPTAFGLIFNLIPIGAASLIFLLFSGALFAGILDVYVSSLETSSSIRLVLAATALPIGLMLLSAVIYLSYRTLSAFGIDLIYLYSRRGMPDVKSIVERTQRATGFALAFLPSLGLAIGLLHARNFVANRYCQVLFEMPAGALHNMQHLPLSGGWTIATALTFVGAATAVFSFVYKENRIAQCAIALLTLPILATLFSLFTDWFSVNSRDWWSLLFWTITGVATIVYFLTHPRLYEGQFGATFSRLRIGLAGHSSLDASLNSIQGCRRPIAWAFLPWALFAVYFALVPYVVPSTQLADDWAQFQSRSLCPLAATLVPTPGHWTIFPVAISWTLAVGLLTATLLDTFREASGLRYGIVAGIALLAVAVGAAALSDTHSFVGIYRSIGPLGAIAIDLIFLVSALTVLILISQKSEFPLRILILFVIIMILAWSFPTRPLIGAVVIIAVWLLARRVGQFSSRVSVTLVVLCALALAISNRQQLPNRVGQNPSIIAAVDPLNVTFQFKCWLGQRGISVPDSDGAAKQHRACPPQVLERAGTAEKYPVFIIAAQGGGIYAASAAAIFLARLQDLSPNFAEHIFAISGVSGGAIGSTIFQALVKSASTQPKPKQTLQQKIAEIMQDDYISSLLVSIFPEFLGATARRADALAASFELSTAANDAVAARLLSAPFAQHWAFNDVAPALVLHTTWVETGYRVAFAPFHLHPIDQTLYSFSDELMPRTDCPTEVGKQTCISLMTAAVTSARFPLVLPAFSTEMVDGKIWNFVDGGYSDNSGATTALDLYRTLQSIAPPSVDLRIILITSADPRPDLTSTKVSSTLGGIIAGTSDIVQHVAGLAVATACNVIYPAADRTCVEYSWDAGAPLQIVKISDEAYRGALDWEISRTDFAVLSWMLGEPAECHRLPPSMIMTHQSQGGPMSDQSQGGPMSEQDNDLELTRAIMMRNSCVMQAIVDALR